MLCFIEALRAIATLFILNSHCEGVYPVELSIGGEFGLAMFFLLTGYLSANITGETSFRKWFPKRALRIYLSLWLADAVLLLCGDMTLSGPMDAIRMLIYPTQRWFASFIVILYGIYYVFQKYVFLNRPAGAVCATAGLFVAAYLAIYCFLDNGVPHIQTSSWHAKLLWVGCAFIGLSIRRTGAIERIRNRGGGAVPASVRAVSAALWREQNPLSHGSADAAAVPVLSYADRVGRLPVCLYGNG